MTLSHYYPNARCDATWETKGATIGAVACNSTADLAPIWGEVGGFVLY